MFKPRQPQKEEPPKNFKLPHEPQLPNMKLVRVLFDECERRRGTTIELSFSHAGKTYLLMVLWEKGIEFPAWTLYDEAGGDNAMLFSQGFPPSDLDFVLEMIIMSTSQGGAAPVTSGFIPEELRPSAETLAAQAELEAKKPDDIWKQSVARSTHSGMPAQNTVYPDPLPRPEPPPAPPPPPVPMPQMAPPMPAQMPQQMPLQPGYPPQPPGYPQQMPPGMVPGAQYPGMPPQPGYPQPGYPQPGYPPPQPGYPQQLPPPGYPQVQPPGYAQQQFPGAPQQGAWPQPAAAPAPATPSMPIDMGLISKRTDVTLNSLLLESGLLNSQSLDAAMRMQDLVEEKQLSSRDAARVLARYHSKGKTIEQFIAVAMQELGDGGSGAPQSGAAAGDAAGQGQQAMVSVKDALDLLVRAGVLTDNDIQTANEVRKKHGGDISKILAAANKLDEKTFEAAIICVPLIREGTMKIEQVSIALQYCSRMRTSFDDACTEMNWPNPRKR
jgi:hypothetical protein